jgi:hypothetical protein
MSDYLEAADSCNGPKEISVSLSAAGKSIWLEQEDDMIEIDPKQAATLVGVLMLFLKSV